MRVPNEIRPIIRRADMPQLDSEHYGELLVFLSDFGVECEAGRINPHRLYFHQDVNFDRAMTAPPEALRSPVLLSQELAIFDGNHRSFAHVRQGTETPYLRLYIPFRAGLKLLFKYPLVRRSLSS